MHMKIDDISVRESIYNKIKNDITFGYIKPGERLLESKLTSQFRVSRTPIREAIRQLQSEGLVMVESRKGATVTKLSKEEVEEIYAIRTILEGYGVELAVKRLGGKEKEVLRGFKRLFQEHKKKGMYSEWLDTNIQFHLFFAKGSGNSNLYKIIEDLRMRVHKYQYIATTNPAFIQQYTKDHEEIIDAAIEGNQKLSRKKMENHLRKVRHILTDFIKRFPMI